MAAKTAGTWQVDQEMGVGDLSVVGTTKLHELGKRVRARDVGTTAYGWGDFIYLQGVVSTVRGSVVLIKDDYTTSLIAARDAGAVGTGGRQVWVRDQSSQRRLAILVCQR